MKAMFLEKCHDIEDSENCHPLKLTDIAKPAPDQGQILIRVSACGICHTELDEIEGRATPAYFPMIPGHQIVGTVESLGKGSSRFRFGERVGVAWIASACGECELCKAGYENLCRKFRATGRDINGGYAEFMCIDENFAYRIPENLGDVEAAPLLCAGAIGYRSLELSGIRNGDTLGLTGFGASAHLVLKLVQHKFPDTKVYVFARQEQEQSFALSLGASWAGFGYEPSPEKLNAIIDTTPVWKPVIDALNNLKPSGRLVINAIRKEEFDKHELLELDYPEHLWMEKEIKSVANVTRNDVEQFLNLAAEIPIVPEVETYSLEQANQALRELKFRKIQGAKVLKISN